MIFIITIVKMCIRDRHTRYQFTRMLYAYGTGMTGQNPFADDEEVEITADIDLSVSYTHLYCTTICRFDGGSCKRVCSADFPEAA